MEILEYDNKKLMQDQRTICELVNEIEKEAGEIFGDESKSVLQKVIDEQDAIMDNLALEYNKLMDICKELIYITTCIENTRKKYINCEEKISDLLDRIKVGQIK